VSACRKNNLKSACRSAGWVTALCWLTALLLWAVLPGMPGAALVFAHGASGEAAASYNAAESAAGSVSGIDPGKDPVLARVNRHEIRLSHVFSQIEALSLGDQIDVRGQIERFTDSIITEEVLFQSVVSGALKIDAELREKIKSQVVEQLISRYVRSRINVSEEHIRRYYAENRDLVRGLHVRVSQIQMKSRAECEQAQKRIGSDEDFAREARTVSLDQVTSTKGGDMGYLMPVANSRSPDFIMEFFEMKRGEMRVFESPQGCHLVRVMDIISPPDPSFAKIKEYAAPVLEREQEQALLRQLVERATRGVTVERFPIPAR
jgi:hypothetical protein